MGLDYYAILNVARNATSCEIKMAYRKLAIILHPLRKPYQQHPVPLSKSCSELGLPSLKDGIYWEFLNEAYDVLSNDLWREVFDKYGEEGLKRGTIAPDGFIAGYIYHKDCLRTYSEFFGSNSPYSDLIDAVTKPPLLYKVKEGFGVRKQDPDIIKFLHLSLEDVYRGTMKYYKYTRKEYIDKWFNVSIYREMSISIPVPAGCAEGTRFVFQEHGDQSIQRKSADIVFIAIEIRHPVYRREGSNLHMTKIIRLREALLGFKLKIVTLDNRKLEFKITDIVGRHYEKHLSNEGLVINSNNRSRRGDLIIHFQVEFPFYIPIHMKERVKEVFDDIEDFLKNENQLCSFDYL